MRKGYDDRNEDFDEVRTHLAYLVDSNSGFLLYSPYPLLFIFS